MIYLLSGPVLRDTARLSQRYPPIARYGFWCLNMANWVRYPLPPFLGVAPLGEHAKWRCDTLPSEGYLSHTCAIPYENKANGCDTPLCDTISKRYCAIWGVSRTGLLSLPGPPLRGFNLLIYHLFFENVFVGLCIFPSSSSLSYLFLLVPFLLISCFLSFFLYLSSSCASSSWKQKKEEKETKKEGR